MARTTVPVRVSVKNYEKLQKMATEQECSVTFLADIAMHRFLKMGLNIQALRDSVEDATDRAIDKLMADVPRETPPVDESPALIIDIPEEDPDDDLAALLGEDI